MCKIFNVSADCKPNLHYMVDITPKLEKIMEMVDKGQYFTINRARQYAKTTTLKALGELLKKDYVVVSLDFQMLSYEDFENERAFAEALAREIIRRTRRKTVIPTRTLDMLKKVTEGISNEVRIASLFEYFSEWCENSEKPVVLIIDEVDSAANNQVFLDFLAQLRGYYINRDEMPTFQSVILAGVYDVKNIRRKLRADDGHKVNGPWNIAADFLVDMSFSAKDIAGMLVGYEKDYNTGMDIPEISGLLYDYTSGYPFLVSRICKLIDERIAGSAAFPDKGSAWTKAGFLDSVKILLSEKNTLFESLIGKLNDYPVLKKVLYLLLFQGQSIVYNPDDAVIDVALMFGFVKADEGKVEVANRIFEIRLYNMFLTLSEVQSSDLYRGALQNKNQFIKNGRLDMRMVLEKFVTHFHDIYGDKGQRFLEEDGRRYFLLYLRPIINGSGNYYIESRTRNLERTDVIIDYQGEQFIVELKIWHGDSYKTRGEAQLSGYLDYYHLEKGYMLSFSFNTNKEIGVTEIALGDKVLVEAVV